MKVYSSPNSALVEHVKLVLESHGIACDVRGQFRVITMGAVPPIQCWPELWVVEESQAEEAGRIIRDALESTERDHGHWKCRSCEEVLEGQFTVCWKCGTNRPEDDDA